MGAMTPTCERLPPPLLDRSEITQFNDCSAPSAASPYVPGAGPSREVGIETYNPLWPAWYATLADLIRTALGPAVLSLDHVGSTAVPGLDAKPVIDLDLTVANGGMEATYVPALEAQGFRLAVREPWWYGHRLLRHARPRCNLHVFSPGCPETARHLIFRDWLRAQPEDCELYLRAKRAASEHTVASAGDVEAYNAHKQAVIRQIYSRAFTALGLA